MGLERQQNLVHRGHGIQRQHAQRGRTVDDHVVEAVVAAGPPPRGSGTPRIGGHALPEDRFAAGRARESQLRGREIDVGWNDAQRVAHGH